MNLQQSDSDKEQAILIKCKKIVQRFGSKDSQRPQSERKSQNVKKVQPNYLTSGSQSNKQIKSKSVNKHCLSGSNTSFMPKQKQKQSITKRADERCIIKWPSSSNKPLKKKSPYKNNSIDKELKQLKQLRDMLSEDSWGDSYIRDTFQSVILEELQNMVKFGLY